MKDYKMRRKDREMPNKEALEVLAKCEYGVLSTIGEDGYPYGIPVNYAYDGEKIYFHCAKDSGHKQENLAYCSKVSFCAVCNNAVESELFTEKFESVIVFGTACKANKNKKHGLELLVKKYSPGFTEKGMEIIEKSAGAADVFEISILKISGKRHK